MSRQRRSRRGAGRPTVLVTDGGNGQNRAALSAVRALGRAGYEVHATVTGTPALAGWSRYCAARFAVPPVNDQRYPAAVRSLQEQHGYVATFPASDASLLALQWPGSSLVDKKEVNNRSRAAGFPSLPEHVFAHGRDLLAAAHRLEFPVVVKPMTRRRATDPTVWRADSPGDLDVDPDAGPMVVQPYLQAPMRAVTGVIWAGSLQAVAHQRYLRTWPRDCGVASAAELIEPDVVLEERLPTLLAGYDGLFQVQLLGEHVIDVNPRVYGSMSLTVKAGLNLPSLVCALSAGLATEGHQTRRPRTGVSYRWVEGDLKHLVQAVRARDMTWSAAVAASAPKRRTAHGDLDALDPRPTAGRLIHLLGPSSSV